MRMIETSVTDKNRGKTITIVCYRIPLELNLLTEFRE